jgi:outer membrane protein
MKITNYIINGVLAIAIIILFILQFTGKGGNSKNDSDIQSDSIISHLPVAYIRTDSLLRNYKFYTDMNETLMKRVEDERRNLNARTQRFQKDYTDFQSKTQANAYLTRDRQEQELNRLARMQQDLQQDEARITEELGREQERMFLEVRDTIFAALKLFNTPQKYQVIFSNNDFDNLFYADDSYDITKPVIEFLNARYKPTKE